METTTHTDATDQITEWTIGGYRLRKTEEPGYTDWDVINMDRALPRIEGDADEFGVSCYIDRYLSPEDTIAYATQLAGAAQIARAFNEIVAAN